MLSLTGKVLIVKALGISKFALIASMLHVSENRITKINTIIFNFIWNGKTDKVKGKIIIQKYEHGGIKMVDFKNYVNASKCKWIQRYSVQVLPGKSHLNISVTKKTFVSF